MVEMTIDWTEIERLRETPKPQFVCMACCPNVRLQTYDNGCCLITYCDKHPSIMIKDGKVVGTSA